MQVYRLNPFLHEPGRLFARDDKTIVLIHQGEQLIGLKELRIDVKQIPFNQLKVENIQTADTGSTWWMWLLLSLMLLLLLYAAIRARMNRNPITSGPPIEPAGITPDTATTAFQQYAHEQYPNTTVNNDPIQNFRVDNLTRGRGYGPMLTDYGDNRSRTRNYNGEFCYRANIVFPNGHTEEMFLAEACANPMRYGEVLRYVAGRNFRFVPDPVPATNQNTTVQPPVTSEQLFFSSFFSTHPFHVTFQKPRA